MCYAVMCVCVCQILRENKPKERNGYSRKDCAGLEVGRGRVRVSKCVDPCVACDRARDGRIERDGCCVTDAPLSVSLSLSHTHTSKVEDRSHNVSASVYVSLMHDHLHVHTSLCLYHTHTVSTLPFRHNTHMDTYTRSVSVTHTESVLKKLGCT